MGENVTWDDIQDFLRVKFKKKGIWLLDRELNTALLPKFRTRKHPKGSFSESATVILYII